MTSPALVLVVAVLSVAPAVSVGPPPSSGPPARARLSAVCMGCNGSASGPPSSSGMASIPPPTPPPSRSWSNRRVVVVAGTNMPAPAASAGNGEPYTSAARREGGREMVPCGDTDERAAPVERSIVLFSPLSSMSSGAMSPVMSGGRSLAASPGMRKGTRGRFHVLRRPSVPA